MSDSLLSRSMRFFTISPMSGYVYTRRAVAVVLIALILCSAAFAHPKPGAHADVRISVYDNHVRVDLLMNLMFVDGLIYAPRSQPDDLLDGEERSVLLGLRSYFQSSPKQPGLIPLVEAGVILDKQNHVLIDQLEVAPLEAEYAVVRPAPETRSGFEQNPLMLIPQIHMVLEYPCKRPPRSVTFVWGTFPRDFLAQERDIAPPVEIDAQLIAEGEVVLIKLTREEPGYTWHGTGASASSRLARVPEIVQNEQATAPAISIVIVATGIIVVCLLGNRWGRQGFLAGALCAPVFAIAARATLDIGRVYVGTSRTTIRMPSDAEAREIFESLHTNIYRAFDYANEAEVYDVLEKSVDGALLDAMYNEVFRSLVMYEEGGAVSRVTSVTSISNILEPAAPNPEDQMDRSFGILARWRVRGVVYHWGHSHERLNEYQARYRVSARAGGWRIVEAQTLEQFRVDLGVPDTDIDTSIEDAPRDDTWRPAR